ncbi:tRNA delta(2)-isopentenylpyrophosphate transferase [Prevotella sp. S7-1-8]|uniref:tRNA (adenosine(37)-N6)-dimethylallyltransferase MiaA n=1 Tax=Prevotella sp. S7-1-8 TaxID=1284775 RepID=UPI00050EC539|nr:tRNA (adenosine(37)-N6)-dimethylallyltransferase MiaA [Prevotella sp. S7-1-8]KGF16146.1 tRNA delta(2)-isopentenylpyrophosphate transferase [Prevotella sp. S7-1-8]
MKTLVVVIGPTGVGKTELCLRVAERYDAPIVNADSRQIFAELPIGTAAPTKEQQQRAEHFFVGTHHVDDYYSAAMYERDAINTLDTLFKTHDIVVLSGGSMMYVDAVCKGIDDIPTVDDHTRSLYKRRLSEEGLPALVAELKERDPRHWEIVDRNNPRRVVHALEICHMTGKTYSSFRTNTHKIRPFEILKIGMDRPREELYDRINKRVIDMIEKGLEKEARAMYPRKGLNALNTVGYKEMFAYFDGLIAREEAIRQIQSNTRRYMRKQLTWFKKDMDVKWFSPDNVEDILNYIDKNT